MSKWKEVMLTDVCELIAGFAFKSSDFGDYPDKALKIGDIKPPYVDYNSMSGIDLSKYSCKNLDKYKVEYDDFVLAMTGATIGKIGRYIESSICYINQRVLKFKPLNTVNRRFIYYALCTEYFQKYINNHIDSDSAQPNISANTLSKYTFQIPDLPTQQRIASILSSLDAKIENNNKINAKLEEIAQNLFKEWFVDFGPFKNGKFVESELGLIPEGWRVGTLGEILDIKYGKDHKKLGNGQIPVYGSGGLMRYANKYLYDQESVLIPRKGTLNNIMYVTEPFWTVDTMFYSEVKIPNSAIFAYQFLSQKDMNQLNSGTSIPSMTTEILNKQKLSISSEKVMQEYNNIVKSLYDQIKHNKLEASKLSTLRDTLLPKLMSGEIEV